MKGYNKIKDVMIAALTSVTYWNLCLTVNNDWFAIGFGTMAVFCCMYHMMREADKWNARRSKERGKEECTN